jgi:hypothetical protein
MMLSSSISSGNNIYAGIQNHIPSYLPFLEAGSISSIACNTVSISASNSPLIGTTVFGQLPASISSSPFPGQNAIIPLVDASGNNNIPLPTTQNVFLVNLTLYRNGWNVGLGGVLTDLQINIGVSSLPSNGVIGAIAGSIVGTTSFGTELQGLRNLFCLGQTIGNVSTFFTLSPLTISGTPTSSAYLALQQVGIVTPGSNNSSGQFYVYLTYIAL